MTVNEQEATLERSAAHFAGLTDEEMMLRVAALVDRQRELTNAMPEKAKPNTCVRCGIPLTGSCYFMPGGPEGQWLCSPCVRAGLGTGDCRHCADMRSAIVRTEQQLWQARANALTEHHACESAVAEVVDLQAKLADAQHWRERHGQDAIGLGKRNQELFEANKSVQAEVVDLQARLGAAELVVTAEHARWKISHLPGETCQDLDAVAAALPATYYADRPLPWRVANMVEQWARALVLLAALDIDDDDKSTAP